MEDLSNLIREFISEDLRNIYSKHEPTADSQHALKIMHDAPGVMEALQKINNPQELAAVLEAIIDACPIIKKDSVLKALNKVQRHEKKTRR